MWWPHSWHTGIASSGTKGIGLDSGWEYQWPTKSKDDGSRRNHPSNKMSGEDEATTNQSIQEPTKADPISRFVQLSLDKEMFKKTESLCQKRQHQHDNKKLAVFPCLWWNRNRGGFHKKSLQELSRSRSLAIVLFSDHKTIGPNDSLIKFRHRPSLSNERTQFWVLGHLSSPLGTMKREDENSVWTSAEARSTSEPNNETFGQKSGLIIWFTLDCLISLQFYANTFTSIINAVVVQQRKFGFI